MNKNKDVMIANLAVTKEDENMILTDIPTLQNGFSSNFEIFKNLFPNGLFPESCTNLDLNLTIPNRTRTRKSFAKAKDTLETEVRETFKSSELLNEPQKKDDWFYAIDDMTKEYYEKFEKIPANATQAWILMRTSPPKNYGITSGNHLDEESIFMNESHPLCKSAFIKRWKKYTSKKSSR